MNFSTRERLIEAATRLFADAGFRGASVRDICNQARANPGAVSYHFGGKKQLYRAVLRRAASALASMGRFGDGGDPETEPVEPSIAVADLFTEIKDNETMTRLVLRDLADGGTVAVEALTPPLRSAFNHLTTALGEDGATRGSVESRLLFLSLAAPVFLLTAGWPVMAGVLDLDLDQREELLRTLVARALENHGSQSRA
jgi:AcrR family transcriptional regulator